MFTEGHKHVYRSSNVMIAKKSPREDEVASFNSEDLHDDEEIYEEDEEEEDGEEEEE